MTFTRPDSSRAEKPLHLVFIGLTLSSSWGNGHATTYRGLLSALHARGHRIEFLEPDAPYYALHRDLPSPDFCLLSIYPDLAALARDHGETIARADGVIVGSFVPHAPSILAWVRELASGVVAFYDIDTPVTLAALERGECDYLTPEIMSDLDLYLSFSGGRALDLLEDRYGVARARPLPCAVDIQHYRPMHLPERYLLGYLGTYSSDRQPGLEDRLLQPARRHPGERFVIAGPQYPETRKWPANVDRLDHLPPRDHPAFYARQRFTLNLTREAMRDLGHSPSVRLFEAASCATAILTDPWEGLEDYFTPGKEIIVCPDGEAVARHLRDLRPSDALRLGVAARRRILTEHTPAHRARALETFLRETVEHRLRVGPHRRLAAATVG
jgi:spore maturation protein CgeB